MLRGVCLLFSLLLSGGSFSQTYPAKPIRFIVSFPPGGSSDLVARSIAPRLSERLGQQVLVENRGGAGGNIGVDIVAKAPPDGYTIGLGAAGALSVNASLFASMPFDPQKDLAPVSMLAMIPFLLIAHPSQPSSLRGELLKMMAGIDLLAVPYKGSGPVAADVLGGQVPLGIVDVPSAIANVKAGKLKALAVSTRRRIAAAPDVPTFAEAGIPGYESIGWFGAVAPANTPPEIINKLNREIVEALSVPEIRERVLAAGAEPFTSTPQEFAAFIREEARKWAQVIRMAKVKVD